MVAGVRARKPKEDKNTIRMFYLGGLVPPHGAKDKDGNIVGKASFVIRGNDRPYTVENSFGAFIDVSNMEQARDIIMTHRVINDRGEFAAFTTDPKVVHRLELKRQKAMEAPQEAEQPKKPSRAELLKMLAEMPEETEE